MDVTATRNTRWSVPAQDISIGMGSDMPDLPCAIVAPLTPEQLEVYILHYRIQEITSRLQQPDSILVATDQQQRLRRCRARSPEPEYDVSGRRTNTAIQRRRSTLEAERHRCVEDIMAKLPSYRVPVHYRRPSRFTDRLFVPQTDYPSINFIGQILGPRGSSLKALQARAGGANIVLRGKGSVKEGRVQHRDRKQSSGRGMADESVLPLHVLITATTQRQVEEAKRLIQEVIDDAISEPDQTNERKMQQLRDLAIANGTFRDDEGRLKQQSQRLINHPSSDRRACSVEDLAFEKDYAKLLAEIQDVNASESTGMQQRASPCFSVLPPWRKASTAQSSTL